MLIMYMQKLKAGIKRSKRILTNIGIFLTLELKEKTNLCLEAVILVFLYQIRKSQIIL